MTRAAREPGRFIVVDGPEGSGKTTQVERLERHLLGLGRRVVRLREPGGTRVGERIRDVLLDPSTGEVAPLTEILLFLASRAQLLHEKIRPALERGDVVLLDRFHYSTIAYQIHGLSRGRVPESTVDLVRAINGGLEPHRVVLLDVPPDVGMNRISSQPDRIEGRDPGFHERVRRGFLRQAEEDPTRIKVIDATLPVDDVFRQVLREVERVL